MMTKPSALIHTFVALLIAAFVSRALAGQPQEAIPTPAQIPELAPTTTQP